MEKEYVSILSFVLGSGITFGINYLKMRHDEKKEKRVIYVQKLEEGHKTITAIREIYRHLFLEHLMIISHGIEAASIDTRVKNHTNEFWGELNRLVGDAKAKNKELNKYKMF